MTDELLSQIRILEAERILTFEWLDSNIQEQELTADGLVRHPLLVMDREDGSYLLLDDVQQYHAFIAAGLHHIPVQVCPRRTLRIDVRKVGLVNFHLGDLNRLTSRHPDQIIPGIRQDVAPADFVAIEIAFRYREPLTLFLRHSTKLGCPAPLTLLFESILQVGRYMPVVTRHHWRDAVCRAVPHSGTLSLPPFALADMEAAATTERLFPPNIIKAGTNVRVLNIDFPITVLRDDIPPSEKESFLRELIVVREQSYRTSFFEGSIYILNR
ncbi:MAG: hypothetical protein AB1644_02600 [Candidatus Zixiibacteriota bacterium]